MEAIALKNGLMLAKRKNLNKIIVECDSSLVINSLHHLDRCPSLIHSIISN